MDGKVTAAKCSLCGEVFLDVLIDMTSYQALSLEERKHYDDAFKVWFQHVKRCKGKHPEGGYSE